MRHDVIAATLLVASTAAADSKPDKVDLAPVLDKLEVYRDDLGSYYVLPKDGAFENRDDAEHNVFYGNGKILYRQRVLSTSKRHWTVWAPRAIGMMGGYVDLEKPHVTCRLQDNKAGTHTLTAVPPDDARALLQAAKVFEPLHQRNSRLLARDDEGTYYYVDELLTGHGYRVFEGQKGAMKELPVTNIVHDSAGDIFGTKAGLLKISAADKTIFWIKNGKKTELTAVDVMRDHYLIYRELGIYGELGAVCDDL
jgi:hypothetical protein